MHHKRAQTELYLNLENYYKTMKLLLALESANVPFFYVKELFYPQDL